MIQLITDRTKSDVLLGTKKGRYGAEDLNRVEQAVADLAGLAGELGIPIAVQTKTDWATPGVFSAAQWPVKSQMDRYLSNVHRLCDALEVAADLPFSMENLNWEGANQIEQALLLVYEKIQTALQAVQFDGGMGGVNHGS